MMRAHISNHDYEQLSAYLDGQLAPGERKKLEERLRARPELKEALEDMGRTRALLRMAPRRKAPRNFTLTPAMVGDTGPGRKTSWLLGLNLFPALGFASTLAAVLLVAVILFDVGARPTQPTQTAYNPAPQAADARLANQPTEPAGTQAEKSNTDTAAPSLAAPMAPASPAATAAPEGAMAAGAAPTATPMTTAKLIPGDAVSSAPPIITWDNGGRGGGPSGGSGQPGAAVGMGGGMGGDVYSAPSVPGINGVPLVDAYSGGAYSLPLESVGNSVESPAASEAQGAAPVQPDSAITGTGPILGVPAPEVAGQVIRQQGGSGQRELAPDQSAPEVQPVPAQPENSAPAADSARTDVREREVLGLPILRLVEALLLLVALVAGAGAYFVRRRNLR